MYMTSFDSSNNFVAIGVAVVFTDERTGTQNSCVLPTNTQLPRGRAKMKTSRVSLMQSALRMKVQLP